jgi:hypothetical protein
VGFPNVEERRALSLLRGRWQVPCNDSSVKRAIDLQQLWTHHFPKRQGFQVSLLEVPGNEFFSQVSPIATAVGGLPSKWSFGKAGKKENSLLPCDPAGHYPARLSDGSERLRADFLKRLTCSWREVLNCWRIACNSEDSCVATALAHSSRILSSNRLSMGLPRSFQAPTRRVFGRYGKSCRNMKLRTRLLPDRGNRSVQFGRIEIRATRLGFRVCRFRSRSSHCGPIS